MAIESVTNIQKCKMDEWRDLDAADLLRMINLTPPFFFSFNAIAPGLPPSLTNPNRARRIRAFRVIR